MIRRRLPVAIAFVTGPSALATAGNFTSGPLICHGDAGRVGLLSQLMSGNRIFPHLLGALALALVIYGGGFWLDHHLRTRRGPWAIEFTHAPDDSPMIVIHQPRLGIRDVRVMFPGEVAAAAPETIRFDTPGQTVPWGRVKYEDLTYLPGVVTLELFGHEIEMLPRTIYVNRHSAPWITATNITLTSADRPAALPEPNAARSTAQRHSREEQP